MGRVAILNSSIRGRFPVKTVLNKGSRAETNSSQILKKWAFLLSFPFSLFLYLFLFYWEFHVWFYLRTGFLCITVLKLVL